MDFLYSTRIAKIPSLLREGIFLFIIMAVSAIQCSCDSNRVTLVDIAPAGDGTVLLAVNFDKSQHFLSYRDGTVRRLDLSSSAQGMGRIKKMIRLQNGTMALISEKNGIYLVPENPESSGKPYIHLPVEEGALANPNIRSVNYYGHEDRQSLYITYDTPKGSGVTEVRLKSGPAVELYNHMDTNSSELRSNNIIQVETDMKGNVWFSYSRKEEKGVSRLDTKGEWTHFDRNNSELSDKFVRILRSEKSGQGVDGDNIWFGSISGLSRLEYKPGEKDDEDREKWKLYGERETTGGLIARAIGVRDLVSDAVLDIIDIHVIEKNILLANRSGVYLFNGKSMNRFIPDTVGGLKETRISDINCHEGYVIVKTRPAAEQSQYVDSVCLLDLKKRKWTRLKYFELKKDYPRNIYFIPYREGIDFVALAYLDGNTLFALLDYRTLELKKIEFEMPVIQPDTEASETKADSDSSTEPTEPAPMQQEAKKQPKEPETQAVQ